jgi:hypothetical protein
MKRKRNRGSGKGERVDSGVFRIMGWTKKAALNL